MRDVAPAEPANPPASRSRRRAFIGRLAGLIAAWPVLGRSARVGASHIGPLAFPATPPNADTLTALGDTVLPAELGADGTARAVADFRRWMDGYRPGAEANHGYGTGRIDRLPADPRPQWHAQLAALDTDARRGGASSFAALARERRQAVVRVALAGERGESLPSPLAAHHVALALLAHFYDSPDATDLCYDAQIGRQQCRPLAAQAQRPVSLTRRAR